MELALLLVGLVFCGLLVGLSVALKRLRHPVTEAVSAQVTLGRATASMAHDLNNLLLVIGGHSELIRNSVRSQHTATLADKINEAVLCAGRLTSHVLSLVVDQNEPATAIDVVGHIRANQRLLNDLAGQARVELQTESQQPFVFVRRSLLDQILINLIVNSREAGATEITIRVATFVFAAPSLERLRLELSDNGHGFANPNAEASSRALSCNKPNTTALGLETVTRLVRSSRGNFTIRNQSECTGTIATVELPIDQAGC